MAIKNLKKKGPMPADMPEEDFGFEAELDEEMEEPTPESEAGPSLADFDDDELREELEARGFTVSKEEEEEMPEDEEMMSDSEEDELDF